STLDYLPPSARAAGEYLTVTGREAWIPEVGEMIVMHHRVSACDAEVSPLVEAFRRADVADFSLGLFRMGLPRALISA
ncbi:phosphohydrolase, partial [Acinetobacter baumannii]